jgi:hypothetical protein
MAVKLPTLGAPRAPKIPTASSNEGLAVFLAIGIVLVAAAVYMYNNRDNKNAK